MGYLSEIKSDRLILKPFEAREFELFYAVVSNPQVMRYALMDCIDDEETAKGVFARSVCRETRQCEEQLFWAVYCAEDGKFLGTGDVELINKREDGGCGDIGYFLLPAFWGRGYAVEIARAISGYCFTELGLHRVFACCNANNKGSERTMQKMGMQKEACLRQQRFKDGEWHDELRYSILLEEWNALKK